MTTVEQSPAHTSTAASFNAEPTWLPAARYTGFWAEHSRAAGWRLEPTATPHGQESH
ncbi:MULTISPECIES: hypothetical protein [Micrococcales]|uniref:hypothetical protein n=1 Tax=Micrococcales TaxID=85006 RepID=UPI000C58006D|nr:MULTISPECIES: hypothetical protein [Micrococcales]SMX99981.1 hypothetical protein BSP109_03183 [Brevibacterium sp. Mu109]